MAKAKYQTPAYRAERKAIDEAQAVGQWLWCNETECKHPTRDIAPWQPAHVAHDHTDPTGQRILGPAHRRCNTSEGATRRHRTARLKNSTTTRQWLL